MKNYIIGLTIGIVILLIVTSLSSNNNFEKITGMQAATTLPTPTPATTPAATPTPQPTQPAQPTTNYGTIHVNEKQSFLVNNVNTLSTAPAGSVYVDKNNFRYEKIDSTTWKSQTGTTITSQQLSDYVSGATQATIDTNSPATQPQTRKSAAQPAQQTGETVPPVHAAKPAAGVIPVTPAIPAIPATPAIVSSSANTQTISLTTSSGTINFPNPDNTLTNKINGYDPSTNFVTTNSGKTYLRPTPNGYEEVKLDSDGAWVSTGNSVSQTGSLVTTTTSSATTYKSTAPGGNTQTLDPGLASSVAVSTGNDGRLVFTYNNKGVRVDSPNQITVTNQDGTTTTTITKTGDSYVTYNSKDKTVKVSSKADGSSPLPNVPTLKGVTRNADGSYTAKDGTTLKINNGVLEYNKKSDKENKQTVVNTDGTVIITQTSSDGKINSKTSYKNGLRTTYEIENGRETGNYQTYNKDGSLNSIKDGNKIYSVGPDGNLYYGKYRLSDEDFKKLSKTTQDKVNSNKFKEGKTNWALIGQFEATYNRVSGINLWLDKWDFQNKWMESVDAFFAENYLGVDYAISNICNVYLDKEDAPVSYGRGRDGTWGAHIEGERVSVRDDLNGSLTDSYVYKITFAVNPSNIAQNKDAMLQFRTFVINKDGGREKLRTKKDVEDSDIIRIKADSGEQRADGSNMIVRESAKQFDFVCLDFSDSWDNLVKIFRDSIGDDKTLCNSFTQSNEYLPGIGVWAERNLPGVLTLGTGGSGSSNEDNAKNSGEGEMPLQVSNSATPVTGDGL